MSRLRAYLLAAVALVGGGVTLTVALQDAADDVSPPLECPEWDTQIDRLKQRRVGFFVMFQPGVTIPETHDNRILGTCVAATRTCTVSRQDCLNSYTYSFDLGPNVAGWRLAYTDSHPYFARSWERLAADTANLEFLGGYKEAGPACIATALTGAQCRSLFASINDCWREQPGNIVHHQDGYSPDGNDELWPCDVPMGTDPARLIAGDLQDLTDE